VGYLGNWWPVVCSGVALVAFAPPVWAKTPAEVEAVAEAVTVKIEQNNKIGTGVIVHKQGKVYSLVTNRHVVCGSGLCDQLPSGRQYRLSLSDGQKIQVSAKNIQLLGQDLDLAVIQFASNRSYPIARVADPGKLRTEDEVFTAGFPEVSGQFGFGQGKAIAVVNRRIKGDRGGYSVVYDSPTLPGMSGGGVFNRNGDLVAIHGQGDRYKSGTDVSDDSRVGEKIGLNRGIPIRWLVQGLGERGITVGGRTSLIRVAPPQVPEMADEYFIAGFNKFVDPGIDIKAGKTEAIGSFTKAIQLNSRYSDAYFMRAYSYDQIGESRNAWADYDRAIALNPNYALAYNNRGALKADKLNDPQGALSDYNKAIALTPNSALAYNNRGNLKQEKLNDPQGALADYNKAITLTPNSAEPYNNRGSLKHLKLNDPHGALADYNKAITLNPNYPNACNNRGVLKYPELNDPQGALADYNKAITLNPNYANAYSNRGNLKGDKLNDLQGALADYNQAIALNPNHTNAYYNRGNLKANQLNDPQGALADYNQAIILNPNQASTYYNRGNLKGEKLNDFQGALADYNQAIILNPNYTSAYVNRGNLKYQKLNDPQGALADYNRVVALNPNYANAYYNRGILKQEKLNDPQGALADYNQAIALNSNFVDAYGARGVLKVTVLKDRPGGIADLRQAARLARAQGQTQILQVTLGILNQLGATE
jgi:tetratricopeptide (TPR) repeat protein